ncbi:DUF2225 domain-containing protein [Treponema saccharophilum]|uniref:DUF2225 domain-containing protein n=1 Tax=Treponema saccharophilum TaxID=165 RepID=UPI003870A529
MYIKKKEEPQKAAKISFWSKDKKFICPVCNKEFEREELFQGRTSAGDLTDELHRLYVPTQRYGEVFPLIYSVGACPRCHLSLLWGDFQALKDDKKSIERLRNDEYNRKKAVEAVFPHYDVKRARNLLDGAAMYYLAILSYEKMDIGYSPTFKRAMLSVRLAWICNELERKIPGYHYDFVAQSFYKKALFFYGQTLVNETNGTEPVGNLGSYGPDVDFNYGYNGIIYMNAILEYKYGQTDDMNLRFKKFGENKRSIARIFGIGKSSKEKPGPLLNHARDLYDKLNKELHDANSIEADIEDDEDENVGEDS